jgi:predicted MFS family arabinose efflux permease
VCAALAAAALSLADPRLAAACPSCFGQAEGPLADATRLGLWLLLGVTVCLQGAFVAFFLYLRRKARQAADHELDQEWSALQAAWGGAGRSGTR